MKKKYFVPEVEVNYLTLEQHILDGSGENLKSVDAGDDFWDD